VDPMKLVSIIFEVYNQEGNFKILKLLNP
jgi:hypothetical protein